MALYTYNGTLIAGLTADKDCCCKSYVCYCYVRTVNYVTVVERKRVCYRAAEWDGSKWVYPDGLPCWPTKPEPTCSVTFSGIYVSNCSCAGYSSSGANPYSWNIIGTQAGWDACTTISPPP